MSIQPPDHIPTIPGFRDLRPIRSGAEGAVFRALHERLDDLPVAIKILESSRPDRIQHRLHDHPQIARVHDVGEVVGGDGRCRHYIVMEYVPNARSLVQFAREKMLRAEARVRLFVTVCRAVYHGHARGVVHCDLKPSNILATPDGNVKIIDFGVAKVPIASDSETTLGGTYQYMSPEQFELEAMTLTPASDVYSLGMVLYELLSGDPPYVVPDGADEDAARQIVRSAPIAPLSERLPALSDGVGPIMQKALDRSREHRYRDAACLADDLERWIAGLPSDPALPARWADCRSRAERSRRAARRWAIAAVLTIIALAACLFGLTRLTAANKLLRGVAAMAWRLDAAHRGIALGAYGEPVIDESASRAKILNAYRTWIDDLPCAAEFFGDGFDSTARARLQDQIALIEPRLRDLGLAEADLARLSLYSLRFERIEPGIFLMGATDDGGPIWSPPPMEQPQHEVVIDQPFLMSVTEITQGQFAAVMNGSLPSAHSGPVDLPVEKVRWLDAVRFCNALSRRCGLTERYEIPEVESAPRTDPGVRLKPGSGFRLPFEVEWEYACRAGTDALYSFGSALNSRRYMWHGSGTDSGEHRTHPVGSKLPNGFGLHDMWGNVREWCHDPWHDDFDGAPDGRQSWDEGAEPQYRVTRGNSFFESPSVARSTQRRRLLWHSTLADVGFRVVRDLDSSP